jgi:hypothetical protein
MSSRAIKVGTVFPISVQQNHIDASIPCDKGHCMLSVAGRSLLITKFGPRDYNVKSTNHGMTFDIGGHRILCVFNHQAGHFIYKYDEVFKKTKSMEKARASVKPFKAKLMVESCQKIPVYPPMSEEKKAMLAEKRKEHIRTSVHTGIRTTKRRQLSE